MLLAQNGLINTET